MESTRQCFFLAFIVAATFLAEGPVRASSGEHAVPDFNRFVSPQDEARVPTLTENLAINTDLSRRLVVANKCELRGEAELGRLAEADLEEAFVFIPSVCLWIEVGYAETGTGVRLDTEFISRLLKQVDDLIVYHTHVARPSAVAGYFPAFRDLVGSILINAPYLQSPRYRISHRAVTRIGVFDYGFRMSPATAGLLKKLARSGLGVFAGQNLAYLYRRTEYERRYYENVAECEHRVTGHAGYLSDCFPMIVREFELGFRGLAAPNRIGFAE